MSRWTLLVGILAAFAPIQMAEGQVGRPFGRCPEPTAGTGVILGMVREAATQVPMGFVDIRLIPAFEDPGALVQVAESSPGGRFEFCAVPVGSYTVQGYFDQIGGDLARVSVGPGGATSLTLNLGLASEGSEPGSITGRVIDAESGDPLEGVTVNLLGPGDRVISDPDGRFSFPSISPDTIQIRASRLGYEDAYGSVFVGSSQAVSIEVTLATQAIALDPITVTATRREMTFALPGMEELEQRMALGAGRFILQKEIEDRKPVRMTDMLYGTGVTVMNGGKQIYMGRTLCAPVVYIDDIRVTHGSGASPLKGTPPRDSKGTPPEVGEEDEGTFAADAVNLLHPMHIQAIEVYAGPASTPGQYLDSRSRCGVILIWTRRGPRG